MKPFGFIYLTTNLVNGKRYIGQTTKLNNPEYLGSGKVIRRAIEKYGVANFERQILAYAFNRTDLDFLEESFITEYNAADDPNWYNISPAPHSTKGFKGKKHTEEWKKSRREFGKHRPATQKMIENMRKLGKSPRTQVQIDAFRRNAAKVGKMNKGRKQSIEERQARSQARLGRGRGIVYSIQTTTGIVETDCLRAWCRQHNVNYSSILSTMKHKTAHKSGYRILSLTKKE